MVPILAHFVCKKAKFGVKNCIFLKYVFSYKMTFLGSSDHFSLGSKWFWYIQNDKMYTLGPTESPNGVRKGPRRVKNGPQNPTGPIWAYFGLFFWGPGRKFFRVLLGQNRPNFFSIIFFLHNFGSRRVWDAQKPKIDPVDPPVDPIFGPICGHFGPIWGQKCVFLKNVFSYKMTFLGSSDHFSLGSKWFWYLQK